MKYIKHFEDTNIKDMYKLKKYFIYKAEFNHYIFSIGKIFKYTVRTTAKYILQDNMIQDPRVLMRTTDYDFTPDEIEEHIIYNSDNINDCLNMLQTIINNNKFNI